MNNLYIQNLHWRYATKKFDPSKKIDNDTLDILLESLRLAPSSFGTQLWKFIVVNNVETRNMLTSVAYGQAQVSEASHLIVLCAKKDVTENDVDKYIKNISVKRNVPIESLAKMKEMIMGSAGAMTPEQREAWNKKQVYIALGFLLSTAAQMKVDACPMEGFDAVKVDEILDLGKDGLTVAAICPIGYRSDNDKYASANKVRFDKDEVI